MNTQTRRVEKEMAMDETGTQGILTEVFSFKADAFGFTVRLRRSGLAFGSVDFGSLSSALRSVEL